MNFLLLVGVGILMILAQVLAAVPWLLVIFWQDLQRVFRPAADAGGVLAAPGGAAARQKSRLTLLRLAGTAAGVTVLGGAVWAGILAMVGDTEWNAFLGRIYGSILHLQLAFDLIIGVFALLLVVWPKGGAVALSAFREGRRQVIFYLLVGAGAIMILASVVIPYFTFGEDYKMMQELGYDTIMLVAVLFGCLTASSSISEEIEGRTAITLMSKPVSRRQFLLGKFVGLFLVCLMITLVLGWWFDWMLYAKRGFEKMDLLEYYKKMGLEHLIQAPLAASTGGWPREVLDCLRGVSLWAHEAGATLPGLMLGCTQAMILLALAVSLATRLPMAVNLTMCLGLYFLGHLTPVLVQLARSRYGAAPHDPVSQMLLFVSQAFDAVLPSLEFFNLGPVVVRDTPPPLAPFLKYVGSVGLYGVMYTLILLIAGLVLFEDRDLA
jgi:hypothetical protein